MSELLKDKKLLIIDDEIDFAKVLSWDFNDCGMKVQLASSGLEAISILESHSFDFILSDIEMPNGNGVDVLTFVKERELNESHFFFMTGYTEREESDLLELGMIKLFKKPINTTKVMEEFLKNQ